MGFGLVIGFIVHLQIVTTSNYSTIANSHTQQFTTAHTKSSHSAVSSPVVRKMASNATDPSTFMFMSFLAKNCLTTNYRLRVTLRLVVYRQSARLHSEPLETHGQNLFSQLNTCSHSPYITSSLRRRWVSHLQLLLALASAFILRSESRGTPNHILLSQIRDFPFCRLL
jgi:hypothetical protein